MMDAKLQQICSQATADYFGVATATAETIHKNPNLGLLPPGAVEQLMLNGGVGVTADGIPLFRLVARRANDDGLSPMVFGHAVQAALDKTCYGYCCNRLSLLRVDQLPGNFVGLTLTWGCW